MKPLPLKKPVADPDDALPARPSLPTAGKLIVLPAKLPAPKQQVDARLESKNGPQSGSFGVLVAMMDSTVSNRSTVALARLAPHWRGREVVFLSASSARVGKQTTALFPKLFYNAGEPLAPQTLWRLLPWRAVVVIKAGKVCCWSPQALVGGNVQPLKESK